MKTIEIYCDGISCGVDGVSERQSKATIGNGWTVDVVAHILKGLKEA